MRGRGLLLALAGMVLVMTVRTAPGQPPRRDTGSKPAHILLPGGIGDRDAAEDALLQRLRRSRDLSEVQDLLKKVGINPKDFLDEDVLKGAKNLKDAAELAKQFGKAGINPNDPKLKELIRQVKDSGKLKKEQEDAIRRIIPDLDTPKTPPSNDPNPPDKPPMGNAPMPENQPGKDNPPKPQDGNSPATNPGETGGSSPDPKSSPPSSLGQPSRRAERSSLFGGWLGSVGGGRGLVGEMRNAVKGLLGPGTGLGNYTRNLTSGLRAHLPGLSDLPLGKLARGFGNVVPDALKFRPRDEDRVSAGLPDFSGGLSWVLLLGAVLGGAGVLLWVLVVRPRWGGWGWRDGWRLGAWPVRPSAVRTRGDVVKAFEYLALLLLGRKVSTSHHLDIAGQLGRSQEDPTGRRKNAADELAQLYELARYAPPEEWLSEDDLATARRDLGFLAGGAAA